MSCDVDRGEWLFVGKFVGGRQLATSKLRRGGHAFTRDGRESTGPDRADGAATRRTATGERRGDIRTCGDRENPMLLPHPSPQAVSCVLFYYVPSSTAVVARAQDTVLDIDAAGERRGRDARLRSTGSHVAPYWRTPDRPFGSHSYTTHRVYSCMSTAIPAIDRSVSPSSSPPQHCILSP